MEMTPAVILAAAMLVIAALNLAFGRGDKGGARIAALEAKQIADNAARKEEITGLGHKIEMAALRAQSSQDANHRDTVEMKGKIDNLTGLLVPLMNRLGMHIPAVMGEHK